MTRATTGPTTTPPAPESSSAPDSRPGPTADPAPDPAPDPATQAARTPSALLRPVIAELTAAGLDLTATLPVGAYNGAVDAPYRLPDFGAPDRLLLLVANTRALWPRLLAWRAAAPERSRSPNPVDTYTAEVVDAALRHLPGDLRRETRHSWEPPPRRVAMQRLAQVAGLAHQSPSHLSVHPRYGPWLALRTAVVLDVPGPPAPAPPPDPCGPCAKPCMDALAVALAAATERRDRRLGDADIAAEWLRWLAVRDACPEGRDHRYGDGQIRYHYVKDTALLG